MLVLGGAALAQDNKPALTPAERAQRDADKVFQWIRFHADKPVVKPVSAPTPAPAPAAARLAPKPVARAVPAPTEAALPSAEAAATPEPLVLAAATLTVPVAPPMPVPVTAAEAVAAEAAPEPPLKPLQRVEPEFPRQLLMTLRSGMVLVRFTVQPDGSVAQAEAVQSTNKRLGPAAVSAVSQWRFEPIAKARLATVEVGFSLE